VIHSVRLTDILMEIQTQSRGTHMYMWVCGEPRMGDKLGVGRRDVKLLMYRPTSRV
jgi:hypothetical protein